MRNIYMYSYKPMENWNKKIIPDLNVGQMGVGSKPFTSPCQIIGAIKSQRQTAIFKDTPPILN